jgi:hypothetical protein
LESEEKHSFLLSESDFAVFPSWILQIGVSRAESGCKLNMGREDGKHLDFSENHLLAAILPKYKHGSSVFLLGANIPFISEF